MKNKKLKIPITESSDTNFINDIIREIKENLYSDGKIIDSLLESVNIYNEFDEKLEMYLKESEEAMENSKFKKDETKLLLGYLFFKIKGKHIENSKLVEWITENANEKNPIYKFLKDVNFGG